VAEPARLWLVLLLVWVFLEFGRPPNPLKLPFIISIVSVVAWLGRTEKQWRPQSWGMVAFIGGMVFSGLTAANSFAAYATTKDMVIRLFCICFPLMSLLTSVDRLRWFVVSLLITAVYVGGWAVTHGGVGPSAFSGGQDENYVAAFVGMAVPFAYFSLFVERQLSIKIGLITLLLICVAAIAVGENPSRGGFLGLVAVTLYCLARSPRKRKIAGFVVMGVAAAVMVIVAGPKFWGEIGSTTDIHSGTADVRIEIWKMGLRMWQAHPISGVGGGNFRWVIEDYQTVEQFEKFGRGMGGSIIAHSLPVELLAELGLIGALTLGYLLWRTWKDLGTVRNRVLALSASGPVYIGLKRLQCYADATRASILAVFVNGVFLSLLHYSHIWVLIAIGSVFPLELARLHACEQPSATSRVSSVRSPRSTLFSRPGAARVSRSPPLMSRDNREEPIRE
jgi:O-antigen ligase